MPDPNATPDSPATPAAPVPAAPTASADASPTAAAAKPTPDARPKPAPSLNQPLDRSRAQAIAQQKGMCAPAQAFLERENVTFADLATHPDWAYNAAKKGHAKPENFPLLQQIVIEHGGAYLRRKFAALPGANSAACLAGLQPATPKQLRKERGEYRHAARKQRAIEGSSAEAVALRASRRQARKSAALAAFAARRGRAFKAPVVKARPAAAAPKAPAAPAAAAKPAAHKAVPQVAVPARKPPAQKPAAKPPAAKPSK